METYHEDPFETVGGDERQMVGVSRSDARPRDSCF